MSGNTTWDHGNISNKKPHTETDQCITLTSCRRRDNKWIVAMNKWQTMTDMEVNQGKWG